MDRCLSIVAPVYSVSTANPLQLSGAHPQVLYHKCTPALMDTYVCPFEQNSYLKYKEGQKKRVNESVNIYEVDSLATSIYLSRYRILKNGYT